jgi:hypothetical protein
VSYRQTHTEIRAKLAAARISVEDAADKAWQANDEEFSNWLNHVVSQLDDAIHCIDCIECALSPNEGQRQIGKIRAFRWPIPYND